MSLSLAEIIARYGSVPLTFSSYRKGEFTFRGLAHDGSRITAIFGDPRDVYDFPPFGVDTNVYLDPVRDPDRRPVSIAVTGPDGRRNELVGEDISGWHSGPATRP
jgi:hypothetical protein